MPFTITSRDLAFDPATQSVWYDTDLAILAAALNGEGVVSGCAVTAQGSPDMTVAIAAGVIRIASGALVTVTSGNGTIGAASGSNPRIDLISASNAGVKTVTAGVAAASPKPPALPSGHIGLAFVLVPTSDTTIEADHITDKRFIVTSAGAGTTFPASPVTDQRFWRTDIGLEFYWDGTRWVSSQLFSFGGGWRDIAIAGGASTDSTQGRFNVPYRGTYSLWVVRADLSDLVLTTNDGSKYWTVSLLRLDDAGTETSLGAYTTAGDTVNLYVDHAISVGAVLDASARTLSVKITKTSTPGNILVWGGVYYRIIAT